MVLKEGSKRKVKTGWVRKDWLDHFTYQGYSFNELLYPDIFKTKADAQEYEQENRFGNEYVNIRVVIEEI